MNHAEVPGGMKRTEIDIERLVAECGDALLRTCTVILRDPFLAEDAVQETFLLAYKNADSFRGDSTEKTWLISIAVNVCRSMLRNPWRKRVALTDCVLRMTKRYDMRDATVTQAVMRLPACQREAVTLHYLNGFKLREIARVLDVPVQTVASRLDRARKTLRKALREWYFEEDQF